MDVSTREKHMVFSDDLNMHVPDWFSPFMAVNHTVVQNTGRELVVYNNIARLVIAWSGLKRNYRVSWRLQWGESFISQGSTEFSSEDLAVAFLVEGAPDGSYHHTFLLKKYVGDVAAVEKFIRWEKYLNIPQPGMGWRRDTTFSLVVTPEITAAVTKLLEDNKGK